MILFYLLVVSMPLVRHPLFGSAIGGMTVTKYLGLCCLIYASFGILGTARPRFVAAPQAKAFLAFVFLSLVNYAALGRPTLEENPMVIYAAQVVTFVTTVALINSPDRLRRVLLSAFAAIALASAYTLREYQTQSAIWGAGVRAGLIAGDPNFFSASVVVVLPLAYYWVTEEKRRLERLFALGCIGVCLLGLMAASSRGGFLALAVIAMHLVWRSRARVRSMLAVGAVLGATLVLAPSSPLDRLLKPGTGDEEAKEMRLGLWRAGFKMIQSQPILGMGLGNFREGVRQYADAEVFLNFNTAHNTYLETAAELGIPGLVLFLAVLFLSYRGAGRTAALTDDALLARTSRGIQSGLLGFAVAILFVSAQFLKLFWLVVFLSVCLENLAQRARAVASEATTEGNDGLPVATTLTVR